MWLWTQQSFYAKVSSSTVDVSFGSWQGAYRRERTGSETMKGDEDEDEEAEKNKEVDVLRVELEAFFSRIGTEMLSPKKKKTEKSRA